MAGPRPEDPYSSVPNVEPNTGMPDDYMSVRANANQFGAGIGEATKGLGDTIGQIADKEKQIVLLKQSYINEHLATQGGIEAGIKNDDLTSKFSQLEGHDAAAQRDSYIANMNKNTADVRESLGNPAAQRAYDQIMFRPTINWMNSITSHSDTQEKKGYQDGFKASIEYHKNRIGLPDVANNDRAAGEEMGHVLFDTNTKFTHPYAGIAHTLHPTTNPDGTLNFGDSEAGKSAQISYDNDLLNDRSEAVANRVMAIAFDVRHPDVKLAMQKLDEYNQKGYVSGGVRNVLMSKLDGKFKSESVADTGRGVFDEQLYKWHNQSNPSTSFYSGSLNDDQMIGALRQQEGTDKQGVTFGLQPKTAAPYLQPGESVSNPETAERVARQHLAKLEENPAIGTDPNRLAVAWFSGEGNVNPDVNSPIPYIDGNRKDINGKTTASYVDDMRQKFEKIQSTAQTTDSTSAKPPTNMPLDIWLDKNQAQGASDAYNREYEKTHDVDLAERASSNFLGQSNRQIQELRKSAYQARWTVEQEIDKAVEAGHPYTSPDQLEFADDNIRQAFHQVLVENPMYLNGLTMIMARDAKGAQPGYGSGFWQYYTQVANGQITDSKTLIEHIGDTKGADLTNNGERLLKKFIEDKNNDTTGHAKAQQSAVFSFLNSKEIRGTITGITGAGAAGPVADKKFQDYLEVLLPRIQAGLASNKSLGTLLNPKSADYVAFDIKDHVRDPRELMKDAYSSAMSQAPKKPTNQFDPNSIKSISDLIQAKRDGKITDRKIFDSVAIRLGAKHPTAAVVPTATPSNPLGLPNG